MAVFAAGRYSLESCTEGFVFPYKGYPDQAVPLLFRGEKKSELIIYNLSPVLTNCILTLHEWTIHRVKPHLEVNWRRRIFRFYPDNTRLHFWRRTEIILPHLTEGGNINTETRSLQHRKNKPSLREQTPHWPSWDGLHGPGAVCWWTVCSTACLRVWQPVALQTLSGTSTRRTWTKGKHTGSLINARRGHMKLKNLSVGCFSPEERSMQQ